jgi:ATP-binding cassette subfamily C (CFTR/MRP) protein 1
MLGDMEHLSGSVAFGGSVGYAQQQAWIQNLSVQENITSFGNRPFDNAAYWSSIHDSSLETDLGKLFDLSRDNN